MSHLLGKDGIKVGICVSRCYWLMSQASLGQAAGGGVSLLQTNLGMASLQLLSDKYSLFAYINSLT